VAEEATPLARQVRGHPSGLVHEQKARGLVPALEPALVEGVCAAGRHIGQVERGGARSAQVADAGEEPHQDLGLLGAPLRLVGEARGDHRPVERPAAGHVDRLAVERRSLAALGREALAAHRVEHHADRQPLLVFERDAHAPCSEAVEEVHGAVERVHDPAAAAVPAAARALLADQAVVGALGLQQLADHALGLAVGVRDRIGGRGLGREALGGPPVVRQQHFSGGACRPLGQLEVRVHVIARTANTTPSRTAATTMT
jgi:hypothetical protein